MVEPSDFGLSPAATLAHVGDSVRSPRHGGFWKNWKAAVFEGVAPRLVEIGGGGGPARSRSGFVEPDPSDPSATHQFESARHVRVGAALALPAGRPKAGLVTLHG